MHRSLFFEGTPWPPASPQSIGILGDSTSIVSYLPQSLKWSTLLQAVVGAPVTNFGQNGAETADFLSGGTYRTWAGKDLYLVRFGYNETNLTTFETNLTALVDEILALGAIPWLVTNYGVDYAGGHYSSDRDTTIQAKNTVIEDVATLRSLHTIDLWALIAEWDIRIRNYNVISSTNKDEDVWGNAYSAALDGDGSGGADDPTWYTEIHPNPRGCELIAQYTAAALNAEYDP